MDKDTMHINFGADWCIGKWWSSSELLRWCALYVVACSVCMFLLQPSVGEAYLCSIGYCKLQLSLYQKACLVANCSCADCSGKSQLNQNYWMILFWMFLCNSVAYFSASDLQFSFCNSKLFPVITSWNPPKRIASILLPIKLTRFLPLGSFKRAL